MKPGAKMETTMKTAIDSTELKQLQNAAAKLAALEAGGVDNWEWYGESLKEYRATIEREENLDELLDELCEILFTGAYEPSERGAGFTCTDSSKANAFALLDKRIAALAE
jgi:hypothetical protein